jgi:hypothetical protein
VNAAFYCVADARYFLGAVGLVNSLRLHGHDEPVFVLDVGLEPDQRELLGAEAHVVDPPRDAPRHPWLLKTVVPLAHRSDVAVLIDTDMIATRSLAPLIERAAGDRIVAFSNDVPRFVPEWGELLELGEARPGPYVSSGLVIAGGENGARLLELMDDRQGRVEMGRTIFGSGDADYAFRYPEQDVLNAILRTWIEPDRLDAHPNREAPNPPFSGVRLTDLDAGRCAYADGEEPYVLHHFHRKPWLEPMYHGLYSRLLARLLLGPRIAVRVPTESVPLRMRSGPRARAERARVDAVDVFRRRVLRRPV